MLDEHWVEPGYAAPNEATYPWQWLWDSCFHSLIWAELGEGERALTELATMFGPQDDAGFVPHMNYARDPQASVDLWRRRGSSSITQPPIYGHTIAALTRRGLTVPDSTIEAARRGLQFLVRDRARAAGGMIELCHPWESGADDSPRWDSMCDGPWNQQHWRAKKMFFVATVETNHIGSPIKNPDFAVASVGFNALVAFNIMELESVTGPTELGAAAAELAEAIADRWDADRLTWVDDGATVNGSARARTADALFASLVDPDPERARSVADQIADQNAFGGPCGPSGVHKAEWVYDPLTYWRGPAWPQLSYLLWIAMSQHGLADSAASLIETTWRGAEQSGLAEYWHPDTGQGLGAIPQSWAGLALIMG